MRSWQECRVEDVRLGNIISYGGLTDEVVGKRPCSMGGNTSVFLDLRDYGTLDLYQDLLVEVYR